jgi:cag pathogenicity island protein 24
MTYKRLSNEELQELEPEFVNFLASSQITAPEWLDLKASNSERIEELIAVFSDMVFDNVLKKINYVEHVTRQDWMVFHCKEESLHLIGIQLSDACGLDLTDPDFFEQWNQARDSVGITVYSKEQPYAEQREKIIFQLIESGCTIAEEKLFHTFLKYTQK